MLKCEICGSVNFIKENGYYVCQGCGLKYDMEEAKRLISLDANNASSIISQQYVSAEEKHQYSKDLQTCMPLCQAQKEMDAISKSISDLPKFSYRNIQIALGVILLISIFLSWNNYEDMFGGQWGYVNRATVKSWFPYFLFFSWTCMYAAIPTIITLVYMWHSKKKFHKNIEAKASELKIQLAEKEELINKEKRHLDTMKQEGSLVLSKQYWLRADVLYEYLDQYDADCIDKGRKLLEKNKLSRLPEIFSNHITSNH